MPSEKSKSIYKKGYILGDQYGKSSNIEFTTALKNLFEKNGLNVGMNIPYKGGLYRKIMVIHRKVYKLYKLRSEEIFI